MLSTVLSGLALAAVASAGVTFIGCFDPGAVENNYGGDSETRSQCDSVCHVSDYEFFRPGQCMCAPILPGPSSWHSSVDATSGMCDSASIAAFMSSPFSSFHGCYQQVWFYGAQYNPAWGPTAPEYEPSKFNGHQTIDIGSHDCHALCYEHLWRYAHWMPALDHEGLCLCSNEFGGSSGTCTSHTFYSVGRTQPPQHQDPVPRNVDSQVHRRALEDRSPFPSQIPRRALELENRSPVPSPIPRRALELEDRSPAPSPIPRSVLNERSPAPSQIPRRAMEERAPTPSQIPRRALEIEDRSPAPSPILRRALGDRAPAPSPIPRHALGDRAPAPSPIPRRALEDRSPAPSPIPRRALGDRSPAPSQILRRDSGFEQDRQLARRSRQQAIINAWNCPEGLTPCLINPASDAYECIDTNEELASCGGCIHGAYGNLTPPGGINCTGLDGVVPTDVTCSSGLCVASDCLEGFSLADGLCLHD